jgi:stigma-specific protein Stig1
MINRQFFVSLLATAIICLGCEEGRKYFPHDSGITDIPAEPGGRGGERSGGLGGHGSPGDAGIGGSPSSIGGGGVSGAAGSTTALGGSGAGNAAGSLGTAGGPGGRTGSSGGQSGTPLGGSRGEAGYDGSSGGVAGGVGGAGGMTTACPGGLMSCNGACLDVTTSNLHCGQCGNSCASGEMCNHGKCLLRDGEPCAAPNSCSSGICNIFFRDEDGDGHGAPANSTGRCTTTAPPPGFVVIGDDCCDSGGDRTLAAKIHPGADFQSVSAGGLCGITWDYDCSNAVDLGPDFSTFGYCPYACSDHICQISTCAEVPRKQDPQASSVCGQSVFSCSYVYAGFPTPTCSEYMNGPSVGDPAYRFFTCR